MFGSKRVSVLVVLGLMVFASQAAATTLFWDDFQSDPAGYSSNESENRDPVITGTDVGTSWISQEYRRRCVNVCDDVTPGLQDAHGTNKYLRLKRDDAANPHPQAIGVLVNPEQTLNALVEVKYDLYYRTAGGDQDLGVTLIDSTTVGAGRLFDVYFRSPDPGNIDSGTTQYYEDAGGYHSWGLTFTPNTWESVTTIVNTADQTFSIQVGARTPVTGSWSGTLHQLQSIAFVPDTSYVDAYVDNVSVTASPIPEPGSLLLLAVGALGLLVYAWRKRT
jgi:hypothetical protein